MFATPSFFMMLFKNSNKTLSELCSNLFFNEISFADFYNIYKKNPSLLDSITYKEIFDSFEDSRFLNIKGERSFILESLKIYLESVRELLRTFGVEFKYKLTNSFKFWWICANYNIGEVEFIKILKYELACPIAIFMKNDLPERDPYPSIISPFFFKFIRNIIRKMGGDKAASLTAGINNLKRVFPNLPGTYKEAMEIKHRKTVSKDPIKIPMFIKKKVSRIVAELFPRGWDYGYENKLPYTYSSCVEKSRSKGGQKECWREELLRELGSEFNEDFIDVNWDDQSSKLIIEEDLFQKKLSEFEFRDTYKAKAECVQDPLKLRIITKNEKDFGLLKGVQEKMWKQLQKYPAFLFTGTPAAGEYLEYFFKTLNISKRKSLFISGDYSSATDNFVPEVSELILEQVLNNADPARISPRLQTLAMESITHHRIFYDTQDPVDQKNGQMMGSLLSFPVLCLYNYALWHISMEKYLKTKLPVSWGVKRVLINGDDILFVANKMSYKIWWDTVRLYGLEPSVGKNFSNSSYFTINSMIFKWNYGEKCAKSIAFPKIQYLYNCNKITFDKNKKELSQSNLPNLLAALESEEASYQIKPFNYGSFKKRVIAVGYETYRKYDFRGLFIERINGGHGCNRLDENTRIHYDKDQKFYKEIYQEGFSVKEYLMITEQAEDGPYSEVYKNITETKHLRNKWERKYVQYVNNEHEEAEEYLRSVEENVKLELRKLVKTLKVQNSTSPLIQLRRESKKRNSHKS